MKRIEPSDAIYVQESAMVNAGRGVFAKKDIKKGECIEKCPFIEILPNDVIHLEQNNLITYTFFYGDNKEKALLVLGFGSLYNHSYAPNALYTIHETDCIVVFTAIRDIKKDEEITFDYKQGNEQNHNPLWFEINQK